MKAIFEIREDDNGTIGFMFQGAPSHFDAIPYNPIDFRGYNPMALIVHDLIEHDFINDNGSVEHELKAIGGAMYGRGNHGTITPDGCMNDITSMARDSQLKLAPTNKGMKKFEPIEWMIEQIDMEKLVRYIRSELDDFDTSTKEIKDFINMALRYIRQGARRAHKRFKNSFDMFNMFDKMAKRINEVAKHTCEYSEQLIVQFCFKKQSFKVYNKPIYNDDY